MNNKTTHSKILRNFLFSAMCISCSYQAIAQSDSPSSPLSQSSPSQSSPAMQNASAQVEVAKRIAQTFADALNANDKVLAQSLLDIDSMTSLITDQLSISPASKRGFVRGFKGSVKEGRFIDNIINISPNETSKYTFQRMQDTKEFGVRPVLRIDFSEGGHEFIMLFINESQKIEDFYFGSKGDRATTVTASAAQLLLGNKVSMLSKIMGTQSFDAGLTVQFEKMINYRDQGKIVESYAVLESLPEALQKSRFVIDFGILLGQQIGDEPYLKQLSKLNQYFGDNDSTAFMLLDFHFMNNDLHSALKALDKAMLFWGEDDGALLVVKSNIYLILQDFENAMTYAQLAIKTEPEFDDAYWHLASLYNVTGDYEKLTQVFMTINQLFDWGIDGDAISMVDEFEGYSQSEEFKAAFR